MLPIRFIRFAGLIRTALLAVALTFAAGAQGKTLANVPGEVLVKLTSTADLDPLLGRYQLTLLGRFGARPIYRLGVAPNVSVNDVVAALQLEPRVLIAEPNVVHGSPEARKNVVWTIGTPQAYAQQWAPFALRLDEAHRISTGAGIRVAVLDTGVDRAHPQLAPRLLPGYDFVDDDNDPSEVGTTANAGFGHGTHVAGLVAMVAPGAQIMPLRVLDPNGQGNTWVLAEAIMYAVDPDGDPATDDGANVINLSLGTLERTRILDAVAELATCSVVADDPAMDISDAGYDADVARCSQGRSVVVAAAAGNDATDTVREYPAAERVHGLVAVGASNASAHLASFSNFGSWVGIAAPGDAITSTIPGGGYATWSGTSMASPLVAGTAALLLAADPTLGPDEVIRRIQSRSATLCSANLHEIDAAAALLDQPPPATVCH